MELLSYLLIRGVPSHIARFFECEKSTEYIFVPFEIERETYAIHHFLDNSNKVGYDLKEVNLQLKTDETEYVVVALAEGDDAICLNLNNGSVSLWLIQSGNGEMIEIANSFSEFLKKCTR